MRFAFGRGVMCELRMRAPLRQVGGGTCVLRPTLAGAHHGVREVVRINTDVPCCCSQATTNGACARRHHHRPASTGSLNTAALFVGVYGAKRASSPHRAGTAPARCRRSAYPLQSARASPAKPWPGGGRSASAAPSSAVASVGARSAPRELTRRSCPSVESAANAASSAARPKDEQRKGTWPAGPRTEPQLSGARCPAAALRAPTSTKSRH